ncbi:MAG: hypothetical protein WD851_20605 [Pirellulales bacterium]
MKRKRAAGAPLSLFSFQDIITSVTGVLLLLMLLLAVELTQRRPISPADSSNRIAAEIEAAIEEVQVEIERMTALLASLGADAETAVGYTTFSAKEEMKATEGQIEALEVKLQKLTRQRELSEQQLQALESDRKSRAGDADRLEITEHEIAETKQELEDLKTGNRVLYNTDTTGGQQVFLTELFPDDILVAVAGEKDRPQRFSGSGAVSQFRAWANEQSSATSRFMLIVHPGSTEMFSDLRDHLESRGFTIGFDLLPDGKNAIDPERGAE